MHILKIWYKVVDILDSKFCFKVRSLGGVALWQDSGFSYLDRKIYVPSINLRAFGGYLVKCVPMYRHSKKLIRI